MKPSTKSERPLPNDREVMRSSCRSDIVATLFQRGIHQHSVPAEAAHDLLGHRKKGAKCLLERTFDRFSTGPYYKRVCGFKKRTTRRRPQDRRRSPKSPHTSHHDMTHSKQPPPPNKASALFRTRLAVVRGRSTYAARLSVKIGCGYLAGYERFLSRVPTYVHKTRRGGRGARGRNASGNLTLYVQGSRHPRFAGQDDPSRWAPPMCPPLRAA